MKDREKSRRWAMRGLYAWETRGGERGREIRVLHDTIAERKVTGYQRAYAEALSRLVVANVETLDRTISDLLENWTIDRLSRIDRVILRIGAAELLYVDDTDSGEVVRSAIRLAERYGTDESPRFVNGVLEALRRQVIAG